MNDPFQSFFSKYGQSAAQPEAPQGAAQPTQPGLGQPLSNPQDFIDKYRDAPIAPPPPPDYSNVGLLEKAGNSLGELGRGLYDLPTNTKGYIASVAEGSKPLEEKNLMDDWAAQQQQLAKERMNAPDVNEPTLVGTRGDWRNAMSSIPFSLGSLGGAIAGAGAAALATRNPLAAIGGAAAGAAYPAYRADANMFVRQGLDTFRDNYQKQHGYAPTEGEMKAEEARLQPFAAEHGAVEATYEAVGGVVGAHLMRPLSRAVGAGNILKEAGKFALGMGLEEIPSETATQVAQQRIEQEAGGQKPGDLTLQEVSGALGDVAAPTAIQSLVMGGLGAAGQGIYNRMTGQQAAQPTPQPTPQATTQAPTGNTVPPGATIPPTNIPASAPPGAPSWYNYQNLGQAPQQPPSAGPAPVWETPTWQQVPNAAPQAPAPQPSPATPGETQKPAPAEPQPQPEQPSAQETSQNAADANAPKGQKQEALLEETPPVAQPAGETQLANENQPQAQQPKVIENASQEQSTVPPDASGGAQPKDSQENGNIPGSGGGIHQEQQREEGIQKPSGTEEVAPQKLGGKREDGNYNPIHKLSGSNGFDAYIVPAPDHSDQAGTFGISLFDRDSGQTITTQHGFKTVDEALNQIKSDKAFANNMGGIANVESAEGYTLPGQQAPANKKTATPDELPPPPSEYKIDNLDQLISSGGGKTSVSYYDKKGYRPVAFKDFALVIDKTDNTATVGKVELEQSEQGKGHGINAYKELGDRLAEKGITLISSDSQYAPGKKLWHKLVNQGYAKKVGTKFEFIAAKDRQQAPTTEEVAPPSAQEPTVEQTTKPEFKKPEYKVLPDKKKHAIRRDIERDLHQVLAAESVDVTPEAINDALSLHLDSWLKEAEKSGDTERADVLKWFTKEGRHQLPDEFVKGIQEAAQKRAKQAELDKHRKPEVYQSALSSSMLQHGKENGLSEAEYGDFKAGFDHLLAGKTASTLPPGNEVMNKGYKAAQEWVKTPEGKAWYEGKPYKKLENTGVDLRRWFDAAKKGVSDADKSDAAKAIAAIEKATTRADFFKGIISDDATPGAHRYIDDLRGNVIPFKEWARRSIEGYVSKMADGDFFEKYINDKHAKRAVLLQYELDVEADKRLTAEQRIEILKDLANQYIDMVGQLVQPIIDAKPKTAADAISAFAKLMLKPEPAEMIISAVKAGSYQDLYRIRLSSKDIPIGALRLAKDIYSQGETQSRLLLRNWYKPLSPSIYYEYLKKENETDTNLRKTPLTPPRLDAVLRNGKDWRGGKDVTPEEFKSKFGLADVGFGKYVKSKADQEHLNYAYDAFMDLADLIGVDPVIIGLNGSLHFTIGALGHGKFAAHFQPKQPTPDGDTVPVINLTNTRGDGTVAHEWIHALDDFADRIGGKVGAELATAILQIKEELKRSYDIDKVFNAVKHHLKGEAYWKNAGINRSDVVASAIKAANYYAYRTRQVSKFYQAAQALDKGSSKPYWSNSKEPLARASEAAVMDMMADNDKNNNYLVNNAWVADGAVKPPAYRGAPYPMDKERERFKKAFRALFDAITLDGKEISFDADRFKDRYPQDRIEFEKAVQDLISSIPDMHKQMQDIEKAKETEAEAKRIQAELDAKKAAEEAASAPAAEMPIGALSLDEANSLIDRVNASIQEQEYAANEPQPLSQDEADHLFGKKKSNQPIVPKTGGTKAQQNIPGERTPEAILADFASHGISGLDNMTKGLFKLFGGNSLKSFPGGIDEKTYQEALPYFKEGLENFKAAGKDLSAFIELILRNFGIGIKPYLAKFIVDSQLTYNLSTVQHESGIQKLSNWVTNELFNGRSITWQQLFRQADTSFGGTQAENKYTVKDAYDGLEAGINKMILQFKSVNPGNSIMQSFSDRETMASIGDRAIRTLALMLERVPTQTKRTEEQEKYQQFSTPPTLAYAASWVANINPGETMLEPSAGIGGLAVFAKLAGANVVVNELSARRAEFLKEVLPDARLFTENAEQLNNILPQDVRPTVIVMNPPFSATAGRVSTTNTMNGAKHIEQALKRLAPDGRLVAIVGEGMAHDRPAFKEWWRAIEKQYTVRANIGISGQEYAKYGTTFDNQILVIDKKTPIEGHKPITGKVQKIADLLPLLETVRNERTKPEQSNGGTEQKANQSDLHESDGEGGAIQSQLPGTDAVGGGERGNRDNTSSTTMAGPGQRGGTGGQAVTGGDQKSGGGTKGGRRSDTSGPGGTGGIDQGEGGVSTSGRPIVEDELSNAGRHELEIERIESDEKIAKKGDLTNSIFATYSPTYLRIAGAQEHPGKLVESAAMAAVDPPKPTYTPNLPKSTIESGALSLAQLEAIVYAGQAFNQHLKSGERKGYLVGDGTGVGKGRIIAGTILDAMRSGHGKKAIWVSMSAGLDTSSKEYWEAVGGDPNKFYGNPKDLSKIKEGVIFVTYDFLRGEESNASLEKRKTKEGKEELPKNKRIDEVIEWLGKEFDGVIAFDEAHKMANAADEKVVGRTKKASKAATAGLTLQQELKEARILYVSATSATEVKNLLYAPRLGLWGEGTSFTGAQDFVNSIAGTGVAAMEFVAQGMKAAGAYISRSLSYEDVTQETVEHKLSQDQQDIYNGLARTWQEIMRQFVKAAEETGEGKFSRFSSFWGAHQRFFNAIMTSMQMPTIIADAKERIKNGDAVLFQLTSTGEAQQDREVTRITKDDSLTLEDMDLSPKQTLINLVRDLYPIYQHEQYEDENGKTRSRQVVDSNGEPVINQDMLAAREELIRNIEDIRCVENPLDMILTAFGPENVAENTGRSRRFVWEPDKHGNLKRVEQKMNDAFKRKEVDKFMDDEKKIIVFSEKGGTGFSYHADNTRKNKRHRVHYLVQAGWKAPTAIQGLGRSHRTNQASAPSWKLATTNLPAQKRFMSSIARRLDQLGALTKGERQAGSQGLFKAEDNLENKYATEAVKMFFTSLNDKKIPGMDFEDIAEMRMGFFGMKIQGSTSLAEGKIPTTTRFLNRLLNLEVNDQVRVFNAFFSMLEMNVQRAIENGTYDAGIKTLRGENIKKVIDDVIYEDERSGAKVRFLELESTHKYHTLTFEALKNYVADPWGSVFRGFYKDARDNTVVALMESTSSSTDENGRSVNSGATISPRFKYNFRSYKSNIDPIINGTSVYKKTIPWPTYDASNDIYERYTIGDRVFSANDTTLNVRLKQGGRKAVEEYLVAFDTGSYSSITAAAYKKVWSRMQPHITEEPKTVNAKRYEKISEDEAKKLWEDDLKNGDKEFTDLDNMVTGILLPIWNRIPGNVQATRAQLSDGEVVIGRELTGADLVGLRRNFGIAGKAARMSKEDQWAAIKKGATATLSNGWGIKTSTVSGEKRVELVSSWFDDSVASQLRNLGLFSEKIGFNTRFFIPNEEAFRRLAADAPVTALSTVSEQDESMPSVGEGAVSGYTSSGEFRRALGKTLDRALGKGFTDAMVRSGKIKVINSFDAQKFTTAGGKGRTVTAFYSPSSQTTYFVWDNIPRTMDLVGLAKHEIGVHAMHMGKNDAGFQAILKTLKELKEKDTAVKNAYSRVPKDTPAGNVDEEALAYLAQHNKLHGLVRRFLAWFRAKVRSWGAALPFGWDKSRFVQWANNLNVDDLSKIAEDALGMARGTATQSSEMGPAYALPSLRTKPAPNKVVKAYKLFLMKKSRPGEIFPLFVPNPKVEVPKKSGGTKLVQGGTETGVWVDADIGNSGNLSPRPGWHAGDAPASFHIGGDLVDVWDEEAQRYKQKPTTRDEDTVWAEVEVAADVDWQPEANRRAKRYTSGPKKGEIIPSTAEIKDQIPEDGYYRYKTNPNMVGEWIIGGAVRITRLLGDKEVERINKELGGPLDMPRNTPLNLKKYGFEPDESGNVNFVHEDEMGVMPSVADHVANFVHDHTANPHTWNWIQKNLGTQLGKTAKSATYRKFWERAHSMFSDESRAASRPAGKAPTLLPKYDWRNVGESLKTLATAGEHGHAPLSDVQAVNDALAEGTLWSGTGNPMAGKRFTRGELLNGITSPSGRTIQLTPEQYSLYLEARGAIDSSLDEVAIAEAWKQVRQILPDDPATEIFRQFVADFPSTAFSTMNMSLDAIARAGNQQVQTQAQEIKAKIRQIENHAQMLKSHGYMPLMRFGDYRIDVKDTQGGIAYVARYESPADANKARRQLLSDFPANQGYTVGNVTKENPDVWKLLQGVTPETAMLFARLTGADQDEAMQQWYRESVSQRSALKRMIRRKGYSGFSDDLPRILSSFVTSNAKRAAANYHAGDLGRIVQDEKVGDVQQEMQKLLTHIQGQDTGHDIYAKLRGFMASWYILGSVAGTIVNATQPITMSLPRLFQDTNANTDNAAKLLIKGYKSVGVDLSQPGAAQRHGFSQDLVDAIKRAEENGTIDSNEVYHLWEESMRPLLPKGASNINYMAKAARSIWSAPYAMAEFLNRKATFVAAYILAEQKGMTAPAAFEYATEVVAQTQGIYAKHNRPNFSREGVGSMTMVFKQFSIQYIEMLIRMAKSGPKGKAAAAMALGILLMAGGFTALPFEDDMEDLLDTLAQAIFGKAFVSRVELRKALEAMMGKELANLAMYGATTATPVDMSGRYSMGNLVPGTALAKPSEKDPKREMASFLGAPGTFINSLVDAGRMGLEGNVRGAIKAMSPRAISDVMKGIDMLVTGKAVDSRNNKIVDTDTFDAFSQIMGFNPSEKAEKQHKTWPVQELLGYRNKVESDIAGDIARAISNKNYRDLSDAKSRLKSWNKTNPGLPIVITPHQIRQRVKDMAMERTGIISRHAPREIRGQVKELLR